MRSFFRYLFLLMLFICMICWFNYLREKQQEKFDKYLHNNIEFEGLVTDLKRTGNHEFGIIQLKLTKSHVKYFRDSVQEGIFPYRIRGDIAELYCSVSTDRKLNDTLKVISNNRLIYFNPLFSKEVGNIEIVVDAYNRDFVKKNTVFNDERFFVNPYLLKKDSVRLLLR